MKNSCGLFLFLMQFTFGFAQSTDRVEPKWQQIVLKNISFDLPASMAIAHEKVKPVLNKITKSRFYDIFEITAASTVKNKSANLEIMTTVSEPGDYKKLSDVNPLSDHEREEADKRNANVFKKQRNLYGNVLHYERIKFLQINGIAFLHYGYKRQLPGKKTEYVSVYYAYDDDRMHQFTCIQNVSDIDFWKSDLKNIMNSVKINRQ